MNTTTAYQLGRIYFAIFGLIVLLFGIIEVLVGLTGGCIEQGFLIICDQEDFLLWRGLILFFAGSFYLSSLHHFNDIHQQAKTIMASVMIWLVGGMALLGTILGSIPGPEDGAWFNTFEDFLASYMGPYTPAMVLLPFSLVAIWLISLHKKGNTTIKE